VHAALRCATQHALVTCATEGSCSTRRRCSDAHRTPTCRATFPLILVLQSQRVDGIGDARSLYQAGRRGERSTLLCLEKRARSFMRIPSSRDHTTERLSCPHTFTMRTAPQHAGGCLLRDCWKLAGASPLVPHQLLYGVSATLTHCARVFIQPIRTFATCALRALNEQHHLNSGQHSCALS
jgi:hypothetical protein